MKIALIGDGKTGGQVVELLKDNPPTVFNADNPPFLEKLIGHQVIICFIPGPAFLELIPMLLASKIPVVSGSTGLSWPSDIDQKIQEANTRWIHANNFSLGMNIVKNMIKALSMAKQILDDYNFSLHEIHHVKKLDSPSGTALNWKEWLDDDITITSERIGDVVGTHRLLLNTPTEQITLEHQAKDRKIFAAGALWAANIIRDEAPGLHQFSDIVRRKLEQK